MTEEVPAELTILELLARAGADDQVALIAPGRPAVTYRQLRTNVAQLAAVLNRVGLGRGDRIAIAMGNGSEMVLTLLATAVCATAVPLNPRYKEEEFAFAYEDTRVSALVALPGTVHAAFAAARPDMVIIHARPRPDGTLAFDAVRGTRPARPVELARADDPAIILHTSGTTSQPKRVPIRQRNVVASIANVVATYHLTENDRALCVMPLFHIHGLVASMLSTLASGGTLICPPGFHALEFWQWVATYSPSWYSAVPTMHQMLLARAERNREVIRSNPFRLIRSASAPMPPAVLERMEAEFGAPVLEAYGMTEASHQIASNPLPPAVRKPGTVGFGVGVDLGVMDELGNLLERGCAGEVVIRGANVVDGYENNPEANASAFRNGWFRTGDQGLLDEDGYLRLTGRLKELINRGGEKISPLEIDHVLLRHPAVAEALAFAVPSERLGEEVHAAVVLKGPATEFELRSHCASVMAEFKIPRKFHLVSEIPRGTTGKLQRLAMSKHLNITE